MLLPPPCGAAGVLFERIHEIFSGGPVSHPYPKPEICRNYRTMYVGATIGRPRAADSRPYILHRFPFKMWILPI